MKTSEITVSRRSAQSALKAVKNAAQTLNQALKSFNGALLSEDGYNGKSIWKQSSSIKGATIGDVITAMGLQIDAKNGLTISNLKAFWQLQLGGAFAVYTNVPVMTTSKQRVYVKLGEEYKPLSIYALKAVDKNGYSAAVICKAIEQNWLPKHEEKRAAASLEKAKKQDAFYIKIEDGKFEMASIDNIAF